VNAVTFDPYFHSHKGNFKETFCPQKWSNSVNKRIEKDENNDK